MTLRTARKAVTAALVAGIGALGAAMLDGDLTTAEAIASAGVGLAAGAGTYAVPNARADLAGRRRRTSPR